MTECELMTSFIELPGYLPVYEQGFGLQMEKSEEIRKNDYISRNDALNLIKNYMLSTLAIDVEKLKKEGKP